MSDKPSTGKFGESSPSASDKERLKQQDDLNQPDVTQADAGDTSIESDPPKDLKSN